MTLSNKIKKERIKIEKQRKELIKKKSLLLSKNVVICLRVTNLEDIKVRKLAIKSGMSISDFLHKIVLRGIK